MRVIEIFWIFLKLGLTSFGGPVAHLAYFRLAFVEKHKWFSEAQYAHLLTICQTIPGPASSQVGFSIGLLRGGWLGGISAFIAFTLPSVVLLILFANSLPLLDSWVGKASLHGLGILAFVVVLHALMGMGKQLLSARFTWILATIMFALVLLSDALVWQVLGIVGCALFSGVYRQLDNAENVAGKPVFSPTHYQFSLRSAALAGSVFIVLLVLFIVSPSGLNEYIYVHAPAYYASGAMVFGGGHAVLPFLEQTTVAKGLLSEEVFLAGYGATQALPGPMFSFAAYLGYMTEMQTATNAYPVSMSGAIGGALLATLFIFLPGFLLVSAILPVSQILFVYAYVRRAFVGANAAVVGLLAATLYDPIFTHAIQASHDLVIAGIAFVALNRIKAPVLVLVVLCIGLKITAVYFLV